MKKGQECWIKSGEKVTYYGQVGDRHLVQPIHSFWVGGYEFEPELEEEVSDKIIEVDQVYEKEPIAVCSDSIQKAQAALEEVNEQIRLAEGQLESVHAQLLEKQGQVARYGPLQKAIDYMDGKITHVLTIPSYGRPEIRLVKEVLETNNRYDREALKLLNLAGGTKGDASWRVNGFSDGSGSWTQVELFASKDEAEKHAQKIYEEAIEEWRSLQGSVAWGKADRWVEAFDFIREEPDVIQHREELVERRQSEELKKAKAALAKAQKRVAVAESGVFGSQQLPY